jgi:glycosyltransferase involved in cell wall biosynthesis
MVLADRPLRILYNIPSLDHGGYEKNCVDLSNEAAQRGHRVRILVAQEPGLLAKHLDPAVEVETLRHQGRFFPKGLPKLYRAIRAYQPDVFHGFSNVGNFYGIVMARQLRVPAVVASIGTSVFSRYEKLIYRYSLVGAHAVHVNSAGVQQCCLSIWPSLKDKVTTIGNPFFASQIQFRDRVLREQARHELGLDEQTFCMGTVARLNMIKGHSYLVEACKPIAERFPQAHWVFIGDGPMKAELQDRIAELGLTNRISLLGARIDIANLLQALDLFVLPSMHEGLPTALEEAMAAGLPAIATNVCGSNELVLPGQTGWLVPPADTAALVQVMEEAIADQARCQLYGAAGRRRIEAGYDEAVVMPRYFALYEQLLSANCRSRS